MLKNNNLQFHIDKTALRIDEQTHRGPLLTISRF